MIVNEKINKVLCFLNKHKITYKIVYHPPLFTIEEASAYWATLPELKGCTHCKNLFLRNHSGKRHYLITMESHKSLDFNRLQSVLREGKLSFASQERMQRCLGLNPGSVSPLGLINDIEIPDANPRELFENGHRVKFFIDKELQHVNMMTFHPCDNTASIAISKDDFLHFLDIWGGEIEWFDYFTTDNKGEKQAQE